MVAGMRLRPRRPLIEKSKRCWGLSNRGVGLIMSDSRKTDVENCSARQLKELLGLAGGRTNEEHNWLLELGDRERLELLLTEMCSGTEQSGRVLLEAACSPDSSVDVLTTVKDVAKRLIQTAQDGHHRIAATLLYHLSVASALGYHGQVISTNAPVERLPLYEELALELADEGLAAVFERAVEHLFS